MNLHTIIRQMLALPWLFTVLSWAIVVIISILFYVRATTILDPDFGWHIRLGEVIVTHGIPKTDPFSYTMPSYPFVDHEWLTNVTMYFLYTYTGEVGIHLFFTGIGMIVLLLLLPKSLGDFRVLPLLLTASVLFPRFSARPQVIAWLFFVVLIRIVFEPDRYKSLKWFLPVGFALWANIHGSFVLGLLVLALYALTSVRDKKELGSAVVFLLINILATCINPYVWRVWWEVWMQITDVALHARIHEWRPFYTKVEFGFLAAIPFAVMFLWRYKQRFSVQQSIILVGILFLSFSALRHVVYFLFVSAQFIARGFLYLKEEVYRVPHGQERFHLFHVVLTLCMLLIFCFEVAGNSKEIVGNSEAHSYPLEAVTYLSSITLTGRVFSFYDWGGYLIWKLPEHKVFIDGRMPSFRFTAPHGESNNAFVDYEQLFSGERFEEITNKFNIRYMLLPKQTYSPLMLEKILTAYIIMDVPKPTLKTALESHSWRVIYEDDKALVYSQQ